MMNKTLFFIAICLFSFGIEVNAQHSAMTYNIRYATDRDGINSWENRKEWVAELIYYFEPDVFGIQEGLDYQVQFLDSVLTKYEFVGVARDDGATEGEYAAIFFRSDKLKVVNKGTFWLSPNPSIPSYGWGANYRRICTWAEFEVSDTNQRFFVFNAHFDHESEEARFESAKLIHKKAEQLNEEYAPVLLMGDFNAIPNSEPIEYLSSYYFDSRLISKSKPFGPVGTYNGFDTSHPLDVRIDYIFVNSRISVSKYAVLSNSRQNRTPSDHLPVLISFGFN